MEPWIPARIPAPKSGSAMKPAVIEVPVRAIESVVIDENSAVRHEGSVVEDDMVVIPVGSPMVPAPAKTTKETDAKAEAKRNSWSGKVQPWIPIPAWPDADRLTIHEPGIIFRHVNDLRVGRFDH